MNQHSRIDPKKEWHRKCFLYHRLDGKVRRKNQIEYTVWRKII